MGADKNSSPKNWTRLCPKFTTNDSHANLPRSRTQNRPTNHRNKSQTNPKWMRNSRSKGLSRSAGPGADYPHGLGKAWEDRLRDCGGLSENSLWTTSSASWKTNCPSPSADRPRRRDCPHSPREPSAKLLANEHHRLNGSKHELTRTWRTLGQLDPRGLSAMHGQNRVNSKNAS
jgi:hypothetical protein